MMHIVEIVYTTDSDGEVVEDPEFYPRTLHGPFPTSEAADEWAAYWTDGDTDVHEFLIVAINEVQPDGRGATS